MSAPYHFGTKTMRPVKTPSDIPEGESFLIQFYDSKSVSHEGDERSRTNPGHGYPAYTETFQTVEQFVTTDEKEWRDAVSLLLSADKSRRDFTAIALRRAVIKTTIEVSVV